MNNFTPLFEIPGYQGRLLGPETIPALQGLLERCADYYHLLNSGDPDETAAQSLLEDCPSGRKSADKTVIGIVSAEQRLVGVLDAIREYPSDGCWWVGLLLLEPLERNRGVGQRFYQAFEQWISQFGAKHIYIGVVEENMNALRFWQSVGYEAMEKQLPKQFGDKEHVVITMVRHMPDKDDPHTG
jgi:GNAT superfamily N-acetyltransferase